MRLGAGVFGPVPLCSGLHEHPPSGGEGRGREEDWGSQVWARHGVLGRVGAQLVKPAFLGGLLLF